MLCHQTSQPIMTLLWVPSLNCPPLTCSPRTGTCPPHRYHRRMSFTSGSLERLQQNEILIRWVCPDDKKHAMINMITPLTRAMSSQFIAQSPPPPPPPPLPPQVNGSDSSPFPKMTNGMTGTLANSRPSTGQVKVWKSCLYSLFPQTDLWNVSLSWVEHPADLMTYE